MLLESLAVFAAQAVRAPRNPTLALRRRGAPVVAMLLLHGVLVALWWHQRIDRSVDADHHSTRLSLVWAALPVPVPARSTASPIAPLRQSKPRAATTIRRAPNVSSAVASSPTAQIIAPSVSAPADPAPPAPHTLALDALQQAGSIDRSLRGQTRSLPTQSITLSAQDRLGHAIASAGIHTALAPRMEQRVMHDGRTITRVITASGSYCVFQPGAGATDGIDHAQRGNAATTMDCGHLFD